MNRTVGLIVALLAGSALVAALVTYAVSAAAAGRLPVAYECQGSHHGETRPRDVLIDCLSENVVVKTPDWSYWTAVSARSADATLLVNACRPDCAAGHYRTYPAVLIFYRVRREHGTGYYTRMQLQYRHDGPRKYTYHWGTYPKASIPSWIGGP
jgi:hypothetical protein